MLSPSAEGVNVAMSILSTYEFLSLGSTTERPGFAWFGLAGLDWLGQPGVRFPRLARLDFRHLEKDSWTTKIVSGHQMNILGDLPAICGKVIAKAEPAVRNPNA